MEETLSEGIRLFNTQKFFEAHEALEVLWLKVGGDEKLFLHGLIQVAAAFHHYQRQNRAGFRSLLEKGWGKLDRFGKSRDGLDLATLRRQLQRWRDYLGDPRSKSLSAPPPVPRIKKAGKG